MGENEGHYFDLHLTSSSPEESKGEESQKEIKRLQCFFLVLNTGNKKNQLVLTTVREMSYWMELERQKIIN
jgi:hypothetical protein